MATTSTPDSVTKDAASAMEMLLKTSKYSDLIIRSRDHVFKVHRSVVLPRSTPLAAAMDGKFKESETGEIDLSEDEPLIVSKLLKFLYTNDFDADTMKVAYASVSKRQSTASDTTTPRKVTRSSSWVSDPSRDESTSTAVYTPPTLSGLSTVSNPSSSEPRLSGPLITIAKTYIIAETFMVPALKDLAKSKYEKTVVDNWNSPVFAESVRLLYQGTPESVRDIKDVAVTTAQKNIKALLDRGEFRTLLKEIGEFGLHVLQVATENPVTKELKPSVNVAVKCSHCGDTYYCPGNSNHTKASTRTVWLCASLGCTYSNKKMIYCQSCNSDDFAAV